MIKAVLIINTAGKVRFAHFYEKQISLAQQILLCKIIFSKVNERIMINDNDYLLCNFLLSSLAEWPTPDTKIIYRRFATLIFIFITDSSESQLAILDLIQVFVEVLDRIFESVCELDIIFHIDKVTYILTEMIMGGLVLEMSREEIIKHLNAMNKLAAMSNHTNNGSGSNENSGLGFFSNFLPTGFGNNNSNNNNGGEKKAVRSGFASGYR
ncbi:AP-3 complex subunit sigma [Angomonas deanei]|nr:AP-3 complex subunit sigma [Angomonas deanei]|eukprot:EPY39494.1 AP-3 complex subunit sigma [Angomonas deanei]